MAFAELGTVVPRSGAEYAYFQEAFGKLHPYWGPLPSFICSWVYIMILKSAEVAVLLLTFSEYTIQPFSGLIGFHFMSPYQQEGFKKLIALLTLGEFRLLNIFLLKILILLKKIDFIILEIHDR